MAERQSFKILEPMTTFTDILLGGTAVILGILLLGEADGRTSTFWGAISLFSVAAMTLISAAHHAVGDQWGEGFVKGSRRIILSAFHLMSYTMIFCVTFAAVKDPGQTIILVAFTLKLLGIFLLVSVTQSYIQAGLDIIASTVFGIVMTGLSILILDPPGIPWFFGGLVVLLISLLIQLFRISPHEKFNQNDLSHILQIVTILMYYQAGIQFVDF